MLVDEAVPVEAAGLASRRERSAPASWPACGASASMISGTLSTSAAPSRIRRWQPFAMGLWIEPGTANTLHYDWISNKITLIPETSEQFKTDAGEYSEFANIVLGSGLSAAPELAKALLLFPEEPGGDYGGDGHWIDCVGERLPLCGGDWVSGAGAGVFYLYLGGPRSHAGGHIGFRSAYVSL